MTSLLADARGWVFILPLPCPVREGERHDNKTDAPSTGAARDPGGCCVGGLCGGAVSGLGERGGYLPGQERQDSL